MINTGKLAGRTIFITGASRGIGKAIALKAAKDGANVIIAAKTAEPHPKLPGTIYSAAKEVEAVGGKCLPCIVDVRDENQVTSAVENAVKTFGGIDILINNASAISLTGTLHTDMKRYDLMHNINTRGTFLVSKVCLPYLKKGTNPHIVNISPPLNMSPHWFKDHVAYTMAKYGMSMCVLGMAEEFKQDGIAVNALWPKTAIHTAAIEMLAGKDSGNNSRKPEIMADAAYALICRDSKAITGQYLIDEDILKEEGISKEQLDQYAVNPGTSECALRVIEVQSTKKLEGPMLGFILLESFFPCVANKDNLMPDFFLDIAPSEMKGPSITKPKSDSKVSSGSIEGIFAAITKTLNADLVKATQSIFQFNVTGSNSGIWFIDLKNGTGAAGKGKPADAPDATLTMESKDFFDMFSGKLKPTGAFMTGKLKISGNLQKAMKLEKLMNSLKSKL